MGTYINLCWKDDKIEKFQSLFKIDCYPTELWYSAEEIPDGNLPAQLDVKYLEQYLIWLNHLQFVIDKLPDVFMQKNHTSNSLETIREYLKEDIAAVSSAQLTARKFQTLKIPCWISVG